MKRFAFASIVISLIAVLIPVGMAGALPQAAPLVIPTSTPVSGGGLLIPTSTPNSGQPAHLSEEQIFALNVQPDDVPAEFAANATQTVYAISDIVAQVQAGSADLGTALQQIAETYQWTHSYLSEYTACLDNLPVSRIASEISEFESPTVAQAWIDDPAVTEFFTAFGITVTPAQDLHGFFTMAPASDATCFQTTVTYGLSFDYQQFMIALYIDVDAVTDPTMVQGLLLQLVPLITTRIDAISGISLPVDTTKPTATPAAGLTTALLPGVAPNTPTTTTSTEPPTFADLESVVPDASDLLTALGIPDSPLRYDAASSAQITSGELVDLYTQVGFTPMADVYETVGADTGLIGNMLSTWNTTECPTPPIYLLETHFTIFETPEGAIEFMNNADYAAAWVQVGATFEDHTLNGVDGKLLTLSNITHACGDTSILNLYIPHGHVLLIVGVTVPVGVEADATLGLEGFATYMLQRLDDAGIQ